jgi:hypothetical protein
MNTHQILTKSTLLAGASLMATAMSACAANPAPTMTPSAPPAPQLERVLLNDHFHGYTPYWRQIRGQWAVTNGRLLQARDDTRELNTVMFYDPLVIADADITAEAAMLVAMPQFQTLDDQELVATKRRVAGAGIVFRFQDENNFYIFRTAGEDGVVLGKVVNGEWHELANPRAADFAGVRLQMDTPYALRVRVVGRRIECWIADKAVASLEDGTFMTGRVGLTTFRSRAAFTAIRVVEK